jgi:ribosomal protein S11
VILFLGLQQEVQGSKELESTPFAAQTAAEKAALEALSTGMKNVEILVKGQGSGRNSN